MQATESGGSVLGTKEPDWIEALATTQNQVRSCAVLPSCCGTEPETTGAVPQHESATSDGKRVSNHLPKEKHESEETPLRENASSFVGHPDALRQLRGTLNLYAFRFGTQRVRFSLVA